MLIFHQWMVSIFGPNCHNNDDRIVIMVAKVGRFAIHMELNSCKINYSHTHYLVPFIINQLSMWWVFVFRLYSKSITLSTTIPMDGLVKSIQLTVCTELGHPVVRDNSQGCWTSSSFYEVVRSDECLSRVTLSYI